VVISRDHRRHRLEGHPRGEEPLDHGVVQVAGDPFPVLEHAQVFAGLAKPFARFDARSDIAYGRDYEDARRCSERTEADLDRELRAVATPTEQVVTRSHRSRAGLRAISRAVRIVGSAEALRYQFLDGPPEQLRALVFEEVLGLAVDEQDSTGLVGDHHRIRG